MGVGCVLPDAFRVDSFWKNTLAGHRALRTLNGGPYAWERYHDLGGSDTERSRSIVGARVDGWAFDWRRFRVPPKDVETVNPLAFMTVDAGAQALDAVKVLPKERAGVFVGATGFGWQRDAALRIRMPQIEEALRAALGAGGRDLGLVETVRARLDARLGPVTDDTIVNTPSSVAGGRLSMIYDLRGLHYAVDAGFASALAALEVGVRALRDGTLDLALVGGASELLTPLELIAFSRLGGLSAGDVNPFDARAQGTLLGEGVAMFALKRLEDALRDDDEVWAVVRGVGGASDGRSRSLLAPDPDGQALAMRRAYDDAGIDPKTLRFVECHATGTVVGDRSELMALSQLAPRGAWVTSGKAALGHLRGGAGAVGLLRAALALKHRVLPAQVGFETGSEALAASGFEVPRENVPLEGPGPLRAGVSAFSFGGVDYHAVLERFDPSLHAPSKRASTSPRRRPTPALEPIAIVGMGGLFPGADDVPSFWQRLLEGYDATREVPEERWDVEAHYAPGGGADDKSYTRLGCFLDRFPELDPAWGIPPSALETLDPGHLVCLRAAEEALADAGVDLDDWGAREKVAVMLAFLPYQGKKFLADVRVNFREVRAELEEALVEQGARPEEVARISAAAAARFNEGLPPLTEDTLTGYLGSLNAGRIARRFDLKGAHFVVDAACASTHAAVHAAVQALRHRTADWALTGGVWADMQPEFFVGACRFNALSATGSTPFDAAADGFIPGEGGGVFVLRRLDDALRDGQRVHAVIRSVSGSSDGKGRSVLAPTQEGEAASMRQALAEAQLAGADIGYVECHGTGTALGDVVEANACAEAFASDAHGAPREAPLRIGSVKSNIGHLNAAAGVPGLVKAALAVRDGVIPASLKVAAPNPKIDFAGGRIAVVREMTRWDRPPGGLRRAGVSSFGVGGANMHVIVEEHRERAAGQLAIEPGDAAPGDAARVALRADAPSRLPAVARASGATPEELVRHFEALARGFAEGGAEALAAPRGGGPLRAAIVAPSADALARRVAMLSDAAQRGAGFGFLHAQGVYVAQAGAPVVATFPGQGSQYANMGRALAAAEPVFRALIEEYDDAYHEMTGRRLTGSIWTDAPDAWAQNDEDIHCAVMAINVALHRMLAERGLSPFALVGQSAGELSALVVARSLSVRDGLRAVWERTLAVLALEREDPGRMISIRADEARVRPLLVGLSGYAAIAADNGPGACIVSADRRALDILVTRLADSGIEHSVLAVSHGYHSALIADAMPSYQAALATLRFQEPALPIWSTITGAPLSAVRPDAMPEHLARQFVEPVRLRAAIEGAWRADGRLFVECGPKWPLTTFTEAILEGRDHVAQATMHPKVGELESAARALACLDVHGHLTGWPGVRRKRASSGVMPVGTAPPTPEPSDTDAAPAREPEERALREATVTVAELARVAGRSGPTPSREDLLRLLRGIRDLIDEALGEPEAEAVRLAVNAPVRFPSEAPTDRRPPVRAPSQRPARVDARARFVPSRPPPDDVAPMTARELEAKLREAFAGRTGYPTEMLEGELDLEADLGIDTVKQVAVLGELREALGLSLDPAFVPRDHPTLASLALYLEARMQANAADAPTSGTRESVGAFPPNLSSAALAEKGLADRLRRAFSERTGYPVEMLEPGLDLEADLGIDTVKQVAVLSALREELGLPRDDTFELRRHPTLGALAHYFVGRVTDAARALRDVTSRPPRTRSSWPPSHTPGTLRADMRRRLVAAFARRTGYPEEMLESDLDLEADLGIDTVKQVAVLSEVRASIGLDVDETFELRVHPTLGHLVDYFVGRLGGTRRSPARRERRSSLPAAPSSEVGGLLRRAFAERTGYPEEMLGEDLELEADLGIDTVKQVAVLTQVRESLLLAPDLDFVLRDHRTLRDLTEYFRARLRGAAPPPSSLPPARPGPDWPATEIASATFTPRSEGTAPSPHDPSARVVSDGRLIELALGAASQQAPVALADLRLDHPALVPEAGRLTLKIEREERTEPRVRVCCEGTACLTWKIVDATGPNAPGLAPELVPVFEASPTGLNASALGEELGRPAPVSRGWAHAPRWDLVIGEHTLATEPWRRRAADMVELGLWHAALAWAHLLGVSHLVRRVARMRLDVVPEGGGALRVVAQVRPRSGGRALADAWLYLADGRCVGVVEGIEGVAVGAPALDVRRGGESVARWQHLSRRLSGTILPGEDVGW